MLIAVITLVVMSVTLVRPTDDDVTNAKKLLADKGLKEAGKFFALRDEADVKKALDDAERLQRQAKLKKKDAAQGKPAKGDQPPQEGDETDQRIAELEGRLAELRKDYNQPHNVQHKNKIVDEMNRLQMELQRLRQGRNPPVGEAGPPSTGDATDQRIAEIQRQLAALQEEYNQPHSVRSKNKIVEEMNKLQMELRGLMQGRNERATPRGPQPRDAGAAPVEKPRQDLGGKVRELRRQVDAIKNQYAALGNDSAVADAIETLNKKDGKDRKLGPTLSLAGYEKRLVKLEESVR